MLKKNGKLGKKILEQANICIKISRNIVLSYPARGKAKLYKRNMVAS